MTLYSWFSKTNARHEHNTRHVKHKSPKSTNGCYIENYTMWPTASVIQGRQITPPIKKKKHTASVSSPLAASKLSLCTELTVYKV